jgi:hypothetical protein
MSLTQKFTGIFNLIFFNKKKITNSSFFKDSLLIILLFLPTFIMIYFRNLSFAYGTILFSLFSFYFLFDYFMLSKNEKLFLTISSSFLIIHFIICYLTYENLNIEKFAKSFIGLILFYCSSCSFYAYINIKKINYTNIFKQIAYILIFLGFLQIFSRYLFDDNLVFPFREFSHYILVSSPFFLFAFAVKDKNLIILILLLFLLSLMLNPSLIFSLLILICFSFFFKIYFLFSIIIITILVIYFELLPIYYIKRIFFWRTESVSGIVYLYATEVFFNLFRIENFFGSGFQQTGFRELVISTDSRILNTQSLLDVDGESISTWNKFDFSVTGSKIIFELGIFGFIALLIYLFFLFKNYIKFIINRSNNAHKLFAVFCLLSLFIEFFFRGVGYFSTNFYLSLVFFKFLLNRK